MWVLNESVLLIAKTTDALGHNNGISADCDGVGRTCSSLPGTGFNDDGLGFVWIKWQACKCEPLFNCSEAVVQAGADAGAIKRNVQLSIIGILQVVYVERGDDSSDGCDIQRVEKWTQDEALWDTVLAGDGRRFLLADVINVTNEIVMHYAAVYRLYDILCPLWYAYVLLVMSTLEMF